IVTCRLPGKALDKLSKKYNLYIHASKESIMSDEELKQRIGSADAIITLLSNKIDEKMLTQAPNLKIVSNYAVGYNNIDVKACTDRDIWVGHTPGVLTETTADFAFTLMMTAARKIVSADKFVRDKKFKGWLPELFMGTDIHHKKLGIIGMGRIGQALANRAKGFNMDVVYYDSKGDLGLEYARSVEFEELLETSDFISLHVPLVDSTHHLIGEKELEIMKDSAILINTSRGPVVDEAALAKALINEQIGAAGLDVFENEPKVYSDLLSLENVVLAPHIASSSKETREMMTEVAVENVLRVFEGKKPLHAVNTIN
ncbi:MAG: 2-hydroxyacid dehydrogenase, partial [Clostridia bacterium]